MNTGARKAVLICAAIALLAGGFLLALGQPARAQDSEVEALFEKAKDLWKRGNSAEAAATLKELLAKDPSQEAVYDLLRKAEYQMFLDMLTAGGDAELVAKRLLDLAHLGEMQKTMDEEAIKALVDQAVHGEDLGIRTKAVRMLVAKHGEYAVPYLYPFLGSNDTDERVYAILALSELSTEAVLPLVETLESDNFKIQYNAAQVLKKIGDVRAVAGLAALAERADNEAVKEAAAMAAADLGDAAGMVSTDPSGSYLELAERYYMQDASVIKNYLAGYTLWKWKDGKLTHRNVPKYLYNLELAEEACYDSLAADALNQDARDTLAAVHYAEWGVLDA
ncbi:MAG: HEAT repeat domain-containing protein, partial [Planctomycetota bacterium]